MIRKLLFLIWSGYANWRHYPMGSPIKAIIDNIRYNWREK